MGEEVGKMLRVSAECEKKEEKLVLKLKSPLCSSCLKVLNLIPGPGKGGSIIIKEFGSWSRGLRFKS